MHRKHSHNRPVKRLKLRPIPSGIFSNANEVVEQVRLALRDEYTFVIDWSNSCYRDPDQMGDPWTYYFEPCFDELPLDVLPDDVLPGGALIACTRDNIITPRLEDGQCNPLLMPRDRAEASKIMKSHIRPRQDIRADVRAFCEDHFRPHMIGLHIRGPGRLDGGSAELRQAYETDDIVPFDPYFEQVNRALSMMPNAGIFACSDSQKVIKVIQDFYGDRVVLYPSVRSDFGEMQANHPENSGQTFSPYRLGLDMVNEALLLAETDVFIHGNSNVANFVLCADPALLHVYVQA